MPARSRQHHFFKQPSSFRFAHRERITICFSILQQNRICRKHHTNCDPLAVRSFPARTRSGVSGSLPVEKYSIPSVMIAGESTFGVFNSVISLLQPNAQNAANIQAAAYKNAARFDRSYFSAAERISRCNFFVSLSNTSRYDVSHMPRSISSGSASSRKTEFQQRLSI